MKEKPSEIPPLLHHSITLIKAGYIPKLKAKKLVRECRLIGEKCKNSPEQEMQIQGEDILTAVKDFSYFLHEYLEDK